MDIPEIGLGTWQMRGKQCVSAVKTALDIGYRHIDSALAYENHADVAEGISGFDRDKLFITSKFFIEHLNTDFSSKEAIEKAVEQTTNLILKELKTDYVDLLLIHWPDQKLPLNDVLEAMTKLIDVQKVRFIGVSNFTKHHLQDAYDHGIHIDFNQVEFHPYLYQKELLDFSRHHKTELIAYRPFGKGKLLQEEPLFAKIGKKYGKAPSQIILRWILKKKVPVIPKASSYEHLLENFQIFDFNLSEEDEIALDHLNKGQRYCIQDWSEFDY